MKIWKFVTPERIFLDISLPDKEHLLKFLGDVAERMGITSSASALTEGFMARENTMSTGIGNFIALPHTTSPEVSGPVLFLIRLASAMDFDSLDRKPVDLVFALIMPERETELHIQILAGISRVCKNRELLEKIRRVDEPLQLIETIREMEHRMVFH